MQETPKDLVHLRITREGDFTFSGKVSEYEVTAMLQAWQAVHQLRHQPLRNASPSQGVIQFLGRFSGLFPMVVLVMFIAFVATQCSIPQPPTTNIQQGQSHAY